MFAKCGILSGLDVIPSMCALNILVMRGAGLNFNSSEFTRQM
jgi:hypothetical protein